MKNLKSDYRLELINEKSDWNNLLKLFIDASIYQTWSYAEIVQAEKVIEHVAIYEKDQLLGIALIRLKQIPVLKRGIAYIYRGPLWQRKNQENKIENLYKVLFALKLKYVDTNKYIFKFRPHMFSDQILSFQLDNNLNFEPACGDRIYKTLILDLNSSLEEIRKSFKQKWRNCLNQAEKNDLEVISGYDKELYDVFLEIYDQMMSRKNFKESVNTRKKGHLNVKLAPEFKMKIFIAFKDKTPVSALVGSAIGNTGVYLLGATNELGMKYKSAYLLQWEMIKWLKEKSIARYDLGGIDPENNSGVYKFKIGITQNEVCDYGSFESSSNKLIKKVYDIIHLIKVKLMILFHYAVYLEEYGIKIEYI